MTKEQIAEKIKAYEGQENYIDLSDMFNDFQQLNEFIGLDISFDSVQMPDDGNSYTFCTCYSNNIQKSIILDWDVRTNFENQEELIDMLYKYQQEAEKILARMV